MKSLFLFPQSSFFSLPPLSRIVVTHPHSHKSTTTRTVAPFVRRMLWISSVTQKHPSMIHTMSPNRSYKSPSLWSIGIHGFGKSRPTLFFSTTTTTTKSTHGILPGVGKGKTSTGLVGLAVDPEAVPKMMVKYQALLDRMASSDMPPDAEYRKVMEKVCHYRLQVAKENVDDPEKVEELCNCGQVEELVVQADNEMIVLEMYLKNRWWEYVRPANIEYELNLDGGEGGIEWDSKLEKNEQYSGKKN